MWKTIKPFLLAYMYPNLYRYKYIREQEAAVWIKIQFGVLYMLWICMRGGDMPGQQDFTWLITEIQLGKENRE